MERCPAQTAPTEFMHTGIYTWEVKGHKRTRLRISAHKLNIETGRYTTPLTPRENRTCDYCKNVLQNTHVESELHAILFCPLYIKPRTKFHDKVSNSIIEVMRVMSQSKNHFELGQLGKFCYELQDINKAYKDYIKNEV